MAVSVFLFVDELILGKREKDIKKFGEFLLQFLIRKDWQIKKGLKQMSEGQPIDPEYRYLFSFHTNITQAAGEKTAIENRHDFWRESFRYYLNNGKIKGDVEYQKRTGINPMAG